MDLSNDIIALGDLTLLSGLEVLESGNAALRTESKQNGKNDLILLTLD
jgi:hypothetical protein